MKTPIISLACVLILISCTSFKSRSTFEPVAVIELFTSQGCSSCPPADVLLSKTIADAKTHREKIFALSFHIDYWNRLGWSDPFSDKKYSVRQNDYAKVLNPGHIYTPQMIVNGEREFVGSDQHALSAALQHALAVNSDVVFEKLFISQPSGKPWHADYELQGQYAGSKIHFALISLHETTNVKRGENGGRTLQNENVVRQLVSANAAKSGSIDFAPSPVPAPGNMAVIAFVQHSSDLKIIGAAIAEKR